MAIVNLGTLQSNVPLPVGQLVRSFGKAEAYVPFVNGGWVSDGASSFGVSIVPNYNCIFVLRSSLLVQNIGTAAWNRVDIALRCSVNDRGGIIQRAWTAHTSHNALYWQTITLSGVYQLSAGVAYSFGVYTPYLEVANSLYYHQAARHLNMFGYTLGEGAI